MASTDRRREGDQRYSADTWVPRDICAREPCPFEDERWISSICSHTLEDVRDPIWVCDEMRRIAKAGYIEVPSRLEEQTYGFQGPWVGWGHHHWLIEVVGDRIEFVFKHHVLHGRSSDQFPEGFLDELSDEEKVETLWWEGGFEAVERVFMTAEELDPYLADFVSRELAARPKPQRRGLLDRLSR